MRGFGLSVAMVLVLVAGQASAAGIDLSKPYGNKYGCINSNGQEVAADQMLLLTDKELITAASACTFTKTQAQADGSLVVTAHARRKAKKDRSRPSSPSSAAPRTPRS